LGASKEESGRFSVQDNILDDITFESLIDVVDSNFPKSKFNEQTVIKQFNEMLGTVVKDAKFILKKNMNEVMEILKKGSY